MPPVITEELFQRYLAGQATPAEAEAVAAWLAEPANQQLAQPWMHQHWEALAAAPTRVPLAAEEPDYDALLNSLHLKLGFGEPAPVAAPVWRRWAAAAALAGTAAVGGWLLTQRTPAAQEVATAYGEVHTIKLPDGSEATLNGHSTLRYAAGWVASKPREVWLDGEGYFSVKHQPNNQRFVVHTRAGFAVEVLGTKFTVYRRRDQARVVLLSGKVRVDFDDQQRPDVILKPGELLETRDAQPQAPVHKAVRTAPYAAWKDAKLVLEETSIAELATRLQDTYGVEVVVNSPALAERRMTGTVPVSDLEVLLQALQETFHLKATREAGRIVLSELPGPAHPAPARAN
ncbi:FecR domain-containing protein [Hymenobacter sp. DH14]|uniref:FecR domain-containing protein n=1 Tax=Hymenobacter cyanobacteriorum TaxID=2926463 RepID=A0A9X1VF47_9BACT|nr:FecR domain-containing protein [Hymenobacter cyanobacteriorum]MCI1186992.1 FecR domain-containing protein [Hymenobacter cyanobacteriorum]